ncbi:unnamed protein product [Notodromas monacha]|uniref:Uncharacterized protein n=1 Tax=Notodromas monacha TaxID=399045 RepID=A0A7R9BQJ2_9CRUS|nr:unnamed protein product [Notodromas monacha]CAG0918911.1 unnamed protein product [Notodromas monacha]
MQAASTATDERRQAAVRNFVATQLIHLNFCVTVSCSAKSGLRNCDVHLACKGCQKLWAALTTLVQVIVLGEVGLEVLGDPGWAMRGVAECAASGYGSARVGVTFFSGFKGLTCVPVMDTVEGGENRIFVEIPCGSHFLIQSALDDNHTHLWGDKEFKTLPLHQGSDIYYIKTGGILWEGNKNATELCPTISVSPFMYAYMTRKTISAYKVVMETLKEVSELDLHDISIMTDWESSLREAMWMYFPQSKYKAVGFTTQGFIHGHQRTSQQVKEKYEMNPRKEKLPYKFGLLVFLNTVKNKSDNLHHANEMMPIERDISWTDHAKVKEPLTSMQLTYHLKQTGLKRMQHLLEENNEQKTEIKHLRKNTTGKQVYSG